MQQNINAVKEGIQESEIALVKYGNAIRQIDWDVFDYMQNRIGNITSESEFLIKLLGNSELFKENGQLNEKGQAQMGLYAMNYNVYMAQADKYAAEVKRINAEIARDPANKTLIERRETLLNLQRQSIEAAEDEKKAVRDLVENGIKIELDALKELIDAYEDSIDSAKDLHDYQKRIDKQAGEVASIQKQLAAYANDTSEENRARLQKLRTDLSEAMEELNETQYDQFIKDQKKLLDDLYADYESLLNQRLDDTNALMGDMIDATNQSAALISDTIIEQATQVGYTLSDSMMTAWENSATFDVVTRYGASFDSQLTTVNAMLSRIAASVADVVRYGDMISSSTISSTTSTTSTVSSPGLPTASHTALSASEVPYTPPAPTSSSSGSSSGSSGSGSSSGKRVKVGAGTWWIRSAPSMSGTQLGVAKEGDKFTYTGTTKNNFNGIIYKGQNAWISASGSSIIGYKTGGIIADMQKVAMRNGDDMITVNTLKKGEGIMSVPQTEAFRKMVEHLPALEGIVSVSGSLSKFRNGAHSAGTANTFEINIPIEHVQDYNDFVMQLRNDGKFEKFIQSITVDTAVGGSRLAKNKFQW